MQQHIAARQCSPGFDKAQMPGRDPGLAGEVELAHAAALPPLAQMSANGLVLLGHAGIIKDRRTRLNYLERNRPAARSAQNFPRAPMFSRLRNYSASPGEGSASYSATAALSVPSASSLSRRTISVVLRMSAS